MKREKVGAVDGGDRSIGRGGTLDASSAGCYLFL